MTWVTGGDRLGQSLKMGLITQRACRDASASKKTFLKCDPQLKNGTVFQNLIYFNFGGKCKQVSQSK